MKNTPILTNRERQKIEKKSWRLGVQKAFQGIWRFCLNCGKQFKTTPQRRFLCRRCFESNSYYSPQAEGMRVGVNCRE